MTWQIAGAAYDRFVGRYAVKLAPLLADFVRVTPGMRVLDVGCGPGALTCELAQRVGAAHVAGIDASQSFVESCRARLPGADVRHGFAEQLPWPDESFDAALSQLVLRFVSDAEQVARELRRVVIKGGAIGACMWQEGEALQLGHVFWTAAATFDSSLKTAPKQVRFRKPGEISELWRSAGLCDVEEVFLDVRATYQNFDDFWQPFLNAAGSVGAYMASADAERRAGIREACRAQLGDPREPFELSGRACAARARVPG